DAIYTPSLHDALPIYPARHLRAVRLLHHHHRAVVGERLGEERVAAHRRAARLPAPPLVRDLVRRPEERLVHLAFPHAAEESVLRSEETRLNSSHVKIS